MGEQFFPVLSGKADADEMFTKFSGKADETLTQLLWWARALKAARA
ncbi:MAG: hypothetical protein AAB727_01095 [Patescibacteria group bacterium]